MSESPVLIIAFNRPHKLRQLVQSLRVSKPPIMLIAVDGPRPHNSADHSLVQQTQAVVSEIDWPCRILTRFRETNLGLQIAYVDAVSWAMSEFGETIVIEDDVVAGPELYEFLHHNLDQFRNDETVGQINGYNFAPISALSEPGNSRRVTRYPTSYCWASWSRSWNHIDLSIQWGQSVSHSDLATLTGSRLSAAMWKMNFRNAVTGRVDTWDYAWVAALWEHGLKIIAPNRNLCLYDGFDEGTHTRRSSNSQQLDIAPVASLENNFASGIDMRADNWQRRSIYRETPLGLLEKGVASFLLEIERRSRAKQRQE